MCQSPYRQRDRRRGCPAGRRAAMIYAPRHELSEDRALSWASAGMTPERQLASLLGHGLLGLRAERSGYTRMLTARAATRRTVTTESIDSAAINAFAARVNGIESVGLNAVAFVSET